VVDVLALSGTSEKVLLLLAEMAGATLVFLATAVLLGCQEVAGPGLLPCMAGDRGGARGTGPLSLRRRQGRILRLRRLPLARGHNQICGGTTRAIGVEAATPQSDLA